MNGQQTNLLSEIKDIINETKTKFAPDSRVAMFVVEATQENESIILNGETNLRSAKEELLSKVSLKERKIVDNIELLPQAALGEKTFAIVNLSVVNLRKEPKHSAEMVTQSLLGTPVNVLKKAKDGWYLIQTPDSYLGWVDDDAIQLMKKNEYEDWLHSKKIIVNKIYDHCYSTEDIKGQIVSDIVQGNILKVLAEKEKFYEVQFPDNRNAFVEKENAMFINDWLSSIELSGKSILNLAHKYMGVPYLWGGTSVKGFDCSGFTKTVYYMHGIVLPRDASQQVNIGEVVDINNGLDNLIAGDLLFFGTKGTDSTKERVTHVGIYISDLDFIHEGGRVQINSFDPKKDNYSKYRTNTFLRAKRILSSVGKNGVQLVKYLQFYK
jgi:SH3-like domain-containing protein